MTFITADQIVAHAIGDYILQSDWMATEKTKKSLAAAAHVSTYVLPFLFLTRAPLALLFIVGTHFVIDRWRLARYLVWFKNHLAPPGKQEVPGAGGATVKWIYSWEECKGNGYPPDRPVWLTTWLLIIADNLMHVVCNGIALRWLS